MRSKDLRDGLCKLAAAYLEDSVRIGNPESTVRAVDAHALASMGVASACMIAETIRDGFVLVARAIRPSMDDPLDY
jgi:hypothetical protein